MRRVMFVRCVDIDNFTESIDWHDAVYFQEVPSLQEI